MRCSQCGEKAAEVVAVQGQGREEYRTTRIEAARVGARQVSGTPDSAEGRVSRSREFHIIASFGIHNAALTLSLPDCVTRKVKTQAMGSTRVNAIVFDLIAVDRLIAHTTDLPISIKGIDLTIGLGG
jgi:hypothetical protein